MGGAEIQQEHVMALADINNLPDSEILVPMSQDSCIAELGDAESMRGAIDTFGIRRVAQVFLEGTRAPEARAACTLFVAEWRRRVETSDSDESTEAEAWCVPDFGTKLCSSLCRQPSSIR